MIKKLMNYIGEFKRDTILTPIFIMLEAIMEVLIPVLMASIIDKGVAVGNMKHVIVIGLTMLLVSFLSLGFGAIAGKTAATASTGFARNIRRAMFYNIQNYSFSNIDKYSTAGLVTRLTTDVTNVQNAYQMIIRMFVRAPFMLISAMVMCLMINARLSLIFLVALVFLGASLFFIMSNAHPNFKRAFRKYDDLNGSVQENLTGIRVVKAYVREDYEVTKFQKASQAVYEHFVKAERLIVLNNPIMQLSMYASMIALSWLGAKMIVVGDMSTGELMSLFMYVTNILVSLMLISMVFIMVTMSKSSAERIVEILDETSDIQSKPDAITTVKDGSIEFDHVNFSYNGNTENFNLTDIDIKIKSGETIGILGGTGSAKSSFVQLIPRLYDVVEGSVKVGGVDVRDYELEALRNEVAMVLQKNVLFSGTIKENLRWGNPEATEEELIEACIQAQADDFIQSFPDGYDTYIEQGGTNVSGGQKQRLCIARALLKKPKILILDDSTSAVDTKTDAYIRKAFKEAIPNTTKLIIAQRISSIQDADRIIVLNDGKIDDFGTHEQLLAKNAIYQDVYNSQMKGADFDEANEQGA
ncbi:MAG: ABC transporter ATP-binding protein [bacterium]|nr:ABC transporter ATP-binding protein [bacterium]